MRYKLTTAVIIGTFLAAAVAFAGSPIYVENGFPYKWKNGEVKIWFDSGPLSKNISNEKAREMIKEAWEVWEKAVLHPSTNIDDMVDVAGVKFSDMGVIEGGNIDAGDGDDTVKPYEKYFFGDEEAGAGAYNSSRPTVIIFDADGKIMEDLVNKGYLEDGQDTNILGLTDLYAKDKTHRYILNGTIILNGNHWAVTSDPEAFKVAMIHELGHLINLDHSGVNNDCYADQNCAGDMRGWEYLPTMFRFPLTEGGKSVGQDSLHIDDAAWSALLYASDNMDIINKFCSVTGTITDKKNRGFQGAQVVAYEVDSNDNSRRFSVAAITGAFYSVCAENGKYHLAGLRPGKTYRVWYGPIPNWCEEYPCGLMSGINPYAPPRPITDSGGIYNEGGYDFICEKGGDVIEAIRVKLANTDLADEKFRKPDDPAIVCDLGGKVSMPDPSPPPEQVLSPAGVSIDKKGWCSLVVGGAADLWFVLFILPVILFLGLRRKQSS